MKNTDMIEWMNDLDPKYLTEAQQPQIQVRKKTRRIVPALIAAAVAATCLTAGASAYISRNTQMLNKFFGENAEEQISLVELPEPVVYENGQVRLTVETELDDGVRHVVLLSFETIDGHSLQLDEINDGIGVYDYFLVYEDGSSAPIVGSAIGFGWSGTKSSSHTKYRAYYFDDEELANHEQTYLTFTPHDPQENTDNLFDGIRIPVHTEKNVETAEFETPDGFTYQLSCFELIYTGPEAYEVLDPIVLDSMSEAEYQDYLEMREEKYLILNDGTRKKLDSKYGSGSHLSDESGYATDIYRWIDAEVDYIDIDKVAAIEIFGVTYPKKQ